MMQEQKCLDLAVAVLTECPDIKSETAHAHLAEFIEDMIEEWIEDYRTNNPKLAG